MICVSTSAAASSGALTTKTSVSVILSSTPRLLILS